MKKHLYQLTVLIFLFINNSIKSQPSFFFPETTYAIYEETICISVTQMDFTDIVGVDLAFGWDETVLEFQSIQNIHPNMIDLDLGNFDISTSATGTIQLSWDTGDCSAIPFPPAVTIMDDEVLFELCFTVIGEYGDASDIQFMDGTLPMYVKRDASECLNIGLFPHDGEVVISNYSGITGPLEVCPGGTAIYAVTENPCETTYNWTISPPSFGNILGNVDTNIVTINWINESGALLCVEVIDDCNGSYTNCVTIISSSINPEIVQLEICLGECVEYAGEEFCTSHILNLQNQLGCDSTIFLILIPTGPSLTDLGTILLCEGECFEMGDSSFCESGLHFNMLNNYLGCDSIVMVDIVSTDISFINEDNIIYSNSEKTIQSNVSPFSDGIQNWTTIDGEIISTTNNPTITATVPEAGTYCLSIGHAGLNEFCEEECITLYFDNSINGETTVCPNAISNYLTPIDSCDVETEYQWSISPVSMGTIISPDSLHEVDILWHQEGTAQLCVLPNDTCQAVSQFCIQINIQSFYETSSQWEICSGDSIICNGNWYIEAGFYSDTLTSMAGCDSIINCEIFLIDDVLTDLGLIGDCDCITVADSVICDNGFYELIIENGASNGCDSMINLSFQQTTEVTLFGNEVFENVGDTVAIHIRIKDFIDIVAFQFSINWDDSKVNLVDYETQNIPDFNAQNVSTGSNFALASGFIPNPSSISLSDSTEILTLKFEILDEFMGTPISISGNPSAIEISNDSGQSLCVITEQGLIYSSCSLIQSITPDTVLCDPSNFQLFVDAPDAVSFQWFPAGNLNDPTIANPTAFPIFNEFYYVIVTDANGCTEEGSVFVEVPFGLDWSLQPWSNSPVCEGDTLELFSIMPFDIVSWNWQGPGNFVSNEPNPKIPFANEANAGFYNVTLTDDNGCSGTAEFFVDILSPPVAMSFPTTLGCPGEPVEVCFPITNDEYYIFVLPYPMPFTDNCFSIPDSSPEYSGEYCVTLVDGNGCEGVQNCVEIVFPEVLEVDAGFDMELNCLISQVTLTASVAPPGIYQYQWTTSDGCFNSATDVLNPTVSCTGIYELLVIDEITGCVHSDTTMVIENIDLPQIDLDIPTTVCLGSNIEICSPFSPTTYTNSWTSPVGILSIDCFAMSDFAIEDIGTYCLVVTDNLNSCESEFCFYLDITGDCVWSGDTDTSKTVNNFDLLNIGLAYDSIGPLRLNATLDWEGQFAEDWTQTTNTEVNFKHIDTDGNGLINADDTLAVIQNWGQMHNLWAVDDRDMGTPFYIEPDTFIAFTSYALPIILGTPSFLAEDVYGIAFSIEIDSSILSSSAGVGFDNSWLGEINSDMISIQKTFLEPMGGRVDVAITRIDGQNMTGEGQFGIFYITIEDIIFQGPPGSDFDLEKELLFQISNVRAITFQELEIDVDTNPKPSLVFSKNQQYLEQNIKIFPNPTSDILHIQSSEIKLEKVEIFNLAGQQVLSNSANSNYHQIATTTLLPGTYLIRIFTKEEILRKRVIVF